VYKKEKKTTIVFIISKIGLVFLIEGYVLKSIWIRVLIIAFISFAFFFWKKRYEAAAKHSITLQRLCGKKQAKIRHLIGLHFIHLHHPMFM